MKIFFSSVVIAVVLVPAFAIGASKIVDSYPKDLLYKDKPIDTLCITEAQTPGQAVTLSTCGINAVGERKIVGQNRSMLAKGFIGYDYNVFPSGNNSMMPNSYSYYKILGNINGSYIISAINNSGGTEQFTAIYLLKRDGDKLYLNSLASGDRCNNGIANVSINNQEVLFTTYVTPYDFLIISNNNPYNLTGYNDLDSCASCCLAKINYKILPGQDSDNLKILSVDISKKMVASEGQSSYQSCFNKLIADYQTKGEHSLNSEQLNHFVQIFNDECVRKEV